MSIAEDAKQVYESQLKTRLEADHPGKYVAIEPQSGSYYLGTTSLEAALAAKQAHPQRKSFLIRIGHDAAFHLGGCSK